MSPRVVIGITTYLDISQPDVGRRVYDAYAASAAAIAPNQVNIRSVKREVTNRDDFSDLWLTVVPFKLWDKKTGETIENGTLNAGAEWRRVGGLSGHGAVHFRDADRAGPDTITIDHKYARKIDWRRFFQNLVELTQPAYAMLHLFTDDELGRYRDADRFQRFDGPIVGERNFTSWKTNLGEWRHPDPWELSERRRYRFLPELSWANYLGSEFSDEFDVNIIRDRAARSEVYKQGILFEVSDDLADVQDRPVEFDQKRMQIRTAFRPGFFRTRRFLAI